MLRWGDVAWLIFPLFYFVGVLVSDCLRVSLEPSGLKSVMVEGRFLLSVADHDNFPSIMRMGLAWFSMV